MMAVRNTQRKLIFDGNSLMQRANSSEIFGHYWSKVVYADLVTAGKNVSFHNYAIGGKTTTQLIADFPTKMAPVINGGDIVVFYELTNDSVLVLTGQGLYNNIIAYRDLVWACGAKFVVSTGIARSEGVAGQNAAIAACNVLLRNNANQFDGLADPAILPQFDSVADVTNTTYYYDQVHVTNTGYDLMKPSLYNAILPLL